MDHCNSFLHRKLIFDQDKKNDRVNIGVVQLSTDYLLESNWCKLVNHKVTFLSSRFFFNTYITTESLRGIKNNIFRASQIIAQGLAFDVMAFGCTSASIVIGEQEVARQLTKNRGNIPATNPWSASKEAFKYFNVKNIAVFSPYAPDVNFLLYRQLIKSGFSITVFGYLNITIDTKIPKISKLSMIQALKILLYKKRYDAIFMSCTNLPILEYIEEIELLFNVPVISSNAAMFWHCLYLLGMKAKCPGYGTLLNQ